MWQNTKIWCLKIRELYRARAQQRNQHVGNQRLQQKQHIWLQQNINQVCAHKAQNQTIKELESIQPSMKPNPKLSLILWRNQVCVEKFNIYDKLSNEIMKLDSCSINHQ